jgi:hypothetical protein
MAPAVITEHRAGKQQQQWKVVSGELVCVSAPANQQASGIRQLFASAFLPVGYPDSVTPDYRGTLALGCNCSAATANRHLSRLDPNRF